MSHRGANTYILYGKLYYKVSYLVLSSFLIETDKQKDLHIVLLHIMCLMN